MYYNYVVMYVNNCNALTDCRPQFGGNYCYGEARIYETCNTQVTTLCTLSCSQFRARGYTYSIAKFHTSHKYYLQSRSILQLQYIQ